MKCVRDVHDMPARRDVYMVMRVVVFLRVPRPLPAPPRPGACADGLEYAHAEDGLLGGHPFSRRYNIIKSRQKCLAHSVLYLLAVTTFFLRLRCCPHVRLFVSVRRMHGLKSDLPHFPHWPHHRQLFNNRGIHKMVKIRNFLAPCLARVSV